MKYLLIILVLMGCNKKVECKHESVELSGEFVVYKIDTVILADGRMYEFFEPKYFKPFQCRYCKQDTLINPKLNVRLLRQADNEQFSYRQF